MISESHYKLLLIVKCLKKTFYYKAKKCYVRISVVSDTGGTGGIGKKIRKKIKKSLGNITKQITLSFE